MSREQTRNDNSPKKSSSAQSRDLEQALKEFFQFAVMRGWHQETIIIKRQGVLTRLPDTKPSEKVESDKDQSDASVFLSRLLKTTRFPHLERFYQNVMLNEFLSLTSETQKIVYDTWLRIRERVKSASKPSSQADTFELHPPVIH